MKLACRPIAELAVAMNIDQSADQTAIVVRSLASNGWDAERIREVAKFALSNREALKTITYSGAITPLFFIEAEHQKWEAEHPPLGKCFTPYCNGVARVKAWGERYCVNCHETHMDAYRARKRAHEQSQAEWKAVTDDRKEAA